MMPDLKLRVLRKNVYVSAGTSGGWKAKSVDRSKEILQMWDDKEGWINIPVIQENNHIYKDSFEVGSY